MPAQRSDVLPERQTDVLGAGDEGELEREPAVQTMKA